MAEEKVKRWIQKKLDSGVEEDRIKKTLRETGRDPGLVDEVASGGEDAAGEHEGDSLDEQVEDQDIETDTGDDSFELSYTDTDAGEQEEGSVEGSSPEQEEEGSGLSLPSIPSVPTPSFSAPSAPSSPRKIASLAVVLLLVAGIAYGGMSILGSGSVAGAVSNPLGPSCSGDMGAGVKMYSVGESNGQTIADVYTDERAEMVLEIYSDGQKMGEGTRTIEGRGVIRADSVGDRAVFHEVGCELPNATRSY